MAVPVHYVQNTFLSDHCHQIAHLTLDLCGEQRPGLREIPVALVMRRDLVMPQVLAGFCIKRDH